jgi:hypothetical protein
MSTMPYDTGDGDGWGDDGYAVSPEPVSLVVSPDVSRPISPAVAPVVSRVVSPGDDDGGDGGNDGPPLGVGRWRPAADEPAARQGGGGLRLAGHLRALADSELLGGGPGGLRAELADPHPETMRRHWEHVAGHRWRPEGQWGGAAFAAGHLAVTGPTKATGKSLTIIGAALVFAGTRLDWAGDRFARIALPAAVLAAVIVIIAVFA